LKTPSTAETEMSGKWAFREVDFSLT